MEQDWYLRRNRLRQLAAFCQTGVSGSMSAAAARLNLSQPAVSMLIKELEGDLDCRLFVRRGPRLQLQPPGRALLKLALPLLYQVEGLPEKLRLLRREQDRRLRLAAAEPLLSGWLPRLLRGLEWDQGEVEVTVEDSPLLPTRRLMSGNLDLYAGSLVVRPPGLRFLPLPPAGLRLLVPAAHPLAPRAVLAPEELAACRLILPLRRHPPWERLRPLLEERGVRTLVHLRIGAAAALPACVAEGLGVAVVDNYCPDGDARLACVPIRPAPESTYGVYLPPNSAGLPKPLAQDFLRLAGLETDPGPLPEVSS